jgi:CO/xanthine dehydrogenase FAD-binding subunit
MVRFKNLHAPKIQGVTHRERNRVPPPAPQSRAPHYLKTEQILSGKTPQELNLTAVQQILLSEISPITDLRSTREYRARVAMNLLQELIHAKPRG